MKCDKKEFDTFREANHIINIAGKTKGDKHRRKKRPKRAYRCDLCGMVHLTCKKADKSKTQIKNYNDYS